MSDDQGNNPPLSHDQAFGRFGRTRRAEGGIKAQSRRGKMAESWWAARWLAVLESFDIGKRLDRGRSYARQGQVLEISIRKGQVDARVQGSQREPYNVVINVAQIGPADWSRLAKIFAHKPIYSAKLLAGQMPLNIGDAFAECGLSLFPGKQSDLKTRCSCPDWSNPCKHVAAVYYLLGEEFDRDPFFIFRLRGISEEELLQLLDTEFSKGRHLRVLGQKETAQSLEQLEAFRKSQPISAAADKFWRLSAMPTEVAGRLQPPQTSAPLLRRLGKFPFWRGQEDFWLATEAIYQRASEQTLALLSDDSGENTKNKRNKRPQKPTE